MRRLHPFRRRPRSIRTLLYLLAAGGALGAPACAGTLAVRGGTALLQDADRVIRDEPDWEFARETSLPALKILETLLYRTPDDPRLLTHLARAYATAAYAFLEDDWLRAVRVDPPRAVSAERRTIDFYERAMGYAERALELGHPGFGAATRGEPDQLRLFLERTTDRDVPALLWFGFAWGGKLGMQRADPSAVTVLGRLRVVAERLVELDPDYLYGSPLALLGAVEAVQPAVMGGSLDRSRDLFLRSIEVTGGRFLAARVEFAYQYAVAAGDEALFERELRFALAATPDILPEERFLTEVARRRAGWLLDARDALFGGD